MFSPKWETKPACDVTARVMRATRKAGRLHFLIQMNHKTLGHEPQNFPIHSLNWLSDKIVPGRKELLVVAGGMDLGKLVKSIEFASLPLSLCASFPSLGDKNR